MTHTTLFIRHLEQDQFQVAREDGKLGEPVTLAAPDRLCVEGRPNSTLSTDLRWYLEQYLGYSTPPTEVADRITQALNEWGKACFTDLFSGQPLLWYEDARRNGLSQLTVKIASDTPRILAWPWEALCDPHGTTLAHNCLIERQLSGHGDPCPLPESLPEDGLNILLIIARPYGDQDVSYQALARPLVDLLEQQALPIRLHVLRPPTFAQLQNHLRQRPGVYHIVHFDGHGGYGEGGELSAPESFRSTAEGRLVFETDDGEPDAIAASTLTELLAEFRIPIVVLNACQSGMLDENAQDPYASVAAALLKAGIRSVVAMGYSLYVSAAQQFVPAFYLRLLEDGRVAEATRAGRRAMLASPLRANSWAEHPLQDWLVPVLYQQQPLTLPVQHYAPGESPQLMFPAEAEEMGYHGMIGRQNATQALERVTLRQPQAGILIKGMAGIGKTTLVKGYLNWLRQTGGIVPIEAGGQATPGQFLGARWFSFEGMQSLEGLWSDLKQLIFGSKAVHASLEDLLKALRQLPLLLVWDNFETAAGIAGTEVQALLSETDREQLRYALTKLRGGRCKVLITSRAPERWLAEQAMFTLTVGGLQGEECRSYCNALVRDKGIHLNKEQLNNLQPLMEELGGHPVALRIALQQLTQKHFDPEQLRQHFKAQLANTDDTDDSTRRFFAALALLDQGLPASNIPVLQWLGLHRGMVNRSWVQTMAEQTDQPLEPTAVQECFAALEQGGLLHALNSEVYRMLPALSEYLTEQHPANASTSAGFIGFFAGLAEFLAPKPAHEQRHYVAIHKANLYHALTLAQTQQNLEEIATLTEGLASCAYEAGHWSEATRLYSGMADTGQQLGEELIAARAYHQLGLICQKQQDAQQAEAWYRKSLAISEKYNNEHGMASSYHQLGMISEEQRDFQQAEAWYRRSLALKEKYNNEPGMATSYHQLGMIAEEQRDFQQAEAWYRKSLAISEKHSNEHGMASSYHQLGRIAEEQRDFQQAEAWYRKSLTIKEKHNNEHGMANSYHHLGTIAQEQRDFQQAEAWYRKSLTIEEKYNNEHGMASSYHQLGRIAEEQRDFQQAEAWYRKSLTIKEKHNNEHGMANTYHQLGRIAEEQRDFQQAEAWYRKSLTIKEKHNNEHGMANTYHQLGMIAQQQRDFQQAEAWYRKSLAIKEKHNNEHEMAGSCYQLGRLAHEQAHPQEAGQLYLVATMRFANTQDTYWAGTSLKRFVECFLAADADEQVTLRTRWDEYAANTFGNLDEWLTRHNDIQKDEGKE